MARLERQCSAFELEQIGVELILVREREAVRGARRPGAEAEALIGQAAEVVAMRSATGSSNVKIAPSPGSDSTWIRPFIERTSSWQM